MRLLRINSGVSLDYSDQGWSEFKKWLDGTYASLPYVWLDEGAAYAIAAIDGQVYRTCGINKADASDFETNWKKNKSTSTPVKLWNAPLKNGSSSNLAVNGSSVAQTFSFSPDANRDVSVQAMCLIAEFTGSVAIGNKFVADAIGTLANGLLVEMKADDTEFQVGNLKRTRDLIEVSTPQGGFNVISGATSLLQIFFYVPPGTVLKKDGTYQNDDYVKATVRDNLSGFNFLEIFAQGVKL